MVEVKRIRMGRPTKPPVEGERVSLGLRVTADIKRKLEAAAINTGRSISQEAEIRLEQSFTGDRLEALERQVAKTTFNWERVEKMWTENLPRLGKIRRSKKEPTERKK